MGSGLGYATYSIFGKAALKKYHAFTLIFYTFVVSTVCLAPFAGLGQCLHVMAAGGNAPWLALGLGLISTFMPYVCYTTGLENVEAGRASVLAFAEPMVATLAGIAAYHEKLQIRSAAGIGLIFIAIMIINSKNDQERSFSAPNDPFGSK